MGYCDTVFEKFQSFKSETSLCDVSIKVENKIFPAHRLVLAGASEFFRALFMTKMKEKDQREIELKDITPRSFSICLDYMYDINSPFTLEEIDDLLNASNMLQLWQLKEKCIEEILFNLNVENCIVALRLSQMYDSEELENSSRTIILQKTEFLFRSLGFLNTHPAVMRTLLQSDNMKITSEAVVFEALENWIDFDRGEREKYFCEFLQCVRLPTIPRSYLTKTVMKNLHISQHCSQCRNYLMQTSHYLLDGNTRDLSDKQVSMREIFGDSIDILFVYPGEKSVTKYTFENNCFSGEIDEKIINFFPVNINENMDIYVSKNVIYLLNRRKDSPSYFRNYIHDESWQTLPPLPSSHGKGFGVSSFKNYLLLIGGEGSGSVTCFDTICKQWSSRQGINFMRMNFAAVRFGTYIYIIGGMSRSIVISSTERYDFDKNEWTVMPRLNMPRQNAAATVYQGKIFAIGGSGNEQRDALSSVELFREGEYVWTIAKSLDFARDIPRAFILQRSLYVFGGSSEANLWENWFGFTIPLKKHSREKCNTDIKDCRFIALANFKH